VGLSLFAVAAVLRVVLALRPGLWVDEVFSLAMATGHSLEHPARDSDPALGDYVEAPQAVPAAILRHYLAHDVPPAGARRVIRAVFLSDTSPPLYYLLLNGWTRIAGTSDAALRLFSAFWALASFPLLWAIGRKVGGTRTAWMACLLFTLLPGALYYSAEGRMYSLLWFLGLVLAWSTLALAERGSQRHLIVLWILAGAAGLLTHYFFAFAWLACVAWLAVHPGSTSRMRLAAAIMVIGLLVLPWYLQVPDNLGRWRVTGPWLARPLTWGQTLEGPVRFATILLSGRGVWGGLDWVNRCHAVLYVLLGLSILGRGVWPLLSPRRRLLWLWAIAAVLGPLMLDLLRHTSAARVERFALPGIPAAMLLLALALNHLSPRTRIVFLVLTLLAWSPGLRDMYRQPPRPSEPFPTVATRLAARNPPADLVVVDSIPSGVLGVARYADPRTPIAAWTPQLGQRHVPDDAEALLAGRRRVALVKSHLMEESSLPEQWLRTHATLDHEEELFGDRALSETTDILYFVTGPSDGRSASPRPASNG
jgi:hypothetical protein